MKIAELLMGFGAGMATTAILLGINHDTTYEGWVDPHEYKILIGPKDMPECSQEVPLSIWDSMNDMHLWLWVAECVKQK